MYFILPRNKTTPSPAALSQARGTDTFVSWCEEYYDLEDGNVSVCAGPAGGSAVWAVPARTHKDETGSCSGLNQHTIGNFMI